MGEYITNGDKKRLKRIDFRRKFLCYKYLLEEFLAKYIKYFDNHLRNYRKKTVTDELKNLNISPDDKVLFIGCGILPSTPIMLAENTDVKEIITIDNSETYVNKKGLSDRIKIKHADGVTYSVENYDVIFIAGNVWPIKSVLKNLSINMKENANLICRNIRKDIDYIFKEEGLNDYFSIKSSSKHPHGPEFNSLFLVKKNNGGKIF